MPANAPPFRLGDLRTSGLSSLIDADGSATLRIERIEVSDLALQTPLGPVNAASAVLSDVTARLGPARGDAGLVDRIVGARIGSLQLRGASLGPVAWPAGGAPSAPVRRHWRFEPLATLDGAVHADIKDAAWIFDAHVTIPIAHGRVDFNRATVEHIGPDSSMGISRMGIYVDAPNGRNYLYLLSATRVPGANFERRGALLSSWSSDRGSIDLQPFAECFLSGVSIGAPARGSAEMIARTRMRAELRLGDGVIGDERARAVLTGRERGRNRIELSSSPSGPQLVVRVLELAAAETHLALFGMPVSSGTLAGTLSAQITGSPGASNVVANIGELTLNDIVCGDPAAVAASRRD
ncbi:hypothetical protein [Piscinibacter koreensis]|uniref:Uncharacterized protein n=1 Tax=Piscinibacter koreensis TaxID=2742824 RepID=A0A7Y6NQ89_9BURK|nr:hypothetical protein [Schlegelella koreensis]NUZ07343.1 hypothetical protein [Schlegelella koreensis]